jgi:hypothetical protein
MDLLERYLQAVRKYLPWTLSSSRQDDIIAELRSDLESQLEERESGLGRPLTEGEMIDWLRHLGAPIQVAGRYQPVQYLIGPTLFPMYLYVLRLAAIWTIIVYAVIAVITVWAGAGHVPSVSDWIFRLPGTLLNTAFWVTLIFVMLEYILARHPHMLPPMDGISAEWSPSKLPPLEPVPTKKTRSFAQAVAEVIFGYLFFFWLALILKYPFLWLGPGVYYLRISPIAPAPIWWTFYWVVLVINFGQNVWNTIDLLSGNWRRRQRFKPIFFKVFGLIPMAVLIAAPGQIYAVVRNPAVDSAKYGSVVDTINTNIWRGVIVVFAILAIQILWDIYQWLKESRRSAAR